MIEQVPDYVYHLSYFGIFLWFAFLEQITPIPEEVSLVSIGYVSMHTAINPFISGVVAVAGLLTADNLIFYLSLKGSKLINKITGNVSETFIRNFKEKLQKNSLKTLVIMALLPKVRFLSPVISATSGIRWKLFFYINSIVTILYVVVYMLIGILFQKQLQYALQKMELWQHIIFIILMIAAFLFIVFRIRKLTRVDKES